MHEKVEHPSPSKGNWDPAERFAGPSRFAHGMSLLFCHMEMAFLVKLVGTHAAELTGGGIAL